MSNHENDDDTPSPESIYEYLTNGSGGWQSSCPSIDGVRSAIGWLESASAPVFDAAERKPASTAHFGRFQIERELGQGGFGWVFLAIDRTLNRPVALKIPRPRFQGSDGLKRAWLNEAEAAARLDHPQIVPVHEAGEIDNLVYIASAYCSGPTLAEWLRLQGGTVGPVCAAQLVARLADAVAHAHQRGILHRDIKPSNVLSQQVEATDGDSEEFIPRLTDFGLARSLAKGSDGADRADPIGTPRYMAPEQAAGNEREVGVGTDVYALGSVLYEILVGEPPFVDSDFRVTLRRIQEEDVTPARLLERRVPLDLQAICLKCLAKTPVDRYASAAELRDDLARFVKGIPVRARPLGYLESSIRWCRRRPALAGLSAAVISAVMLGAGGILWQTTEVRRHAEVAQQQGHSATQQAINAWNQRLAAYQSLMDMSWYLSMSATSENDESLGHLLARQFLQPHYHHSIENGAGSVDLVVRAAAQALRGVRASLAGDDELAHESLETSLKLWCDILRRYPDDNLSRQSLAVTLFTYRRCLDRQVAAGRSVDTVADGRRTIDEILASDVANPWLRGTYAGFLYELGCRYLIAGQRPEAISTFQASLAECESLLSANGDAPHQLTTVGQINLFLGDIAWRNHKHDDAAGFFQASVTSLQRASELAPQDNWVRLHLANAYRQFGLLGLKDRSHIATEYLERAAENLEMLMASPDHHASVPGSLAGTLADLAPIFERSGDVDRAMAAYARCTEVWCEADQQRPLDANSLRTLAFACASHAELAVKKHQPDIARNQYVKASELFARLDAIRKLPATGYAAWAECFVFAGDEASSAGNSIDAEKNYRFAIDRIDRITKTLQRHPENKALLQRRKPIEDRLAKLADLQGMAVDP
ncbi:MAG: serine/threonine protein kinase [Pirellulales bacterium]|nr:serine/threonine protein kinase [Pirellulales bacterium]